MYLLPSRTAFIVLQKDAPLSPPEFDAALCIIHGLFSAPSHSPARQTTMQIRRRNQILLNIIKAKSTTTRANMRIAQLHKTSGSPMGDTIELKNRTDYMP
jgi:hypothetical protein